MRLPGLVVGGRRGAHLSAHASCGHQSRLRADPRRRVHGRNLMVAADADDSTAADAAVMVVGQRGPAGRVLHGHQFGRRNGDQAVAAVRACRKKKTEMKFVIIIFISIDKDHNHL